MMVDKPVYVTAKGMTGLAEELEHLRTEERPVALERLQEAKSGGDWMENTDWVMHEDELGRIDRRIAELEDMLANAQIIGPDRDKTRVDVGDTVIIRSADGEEERYTIVGVAEADPAAGFISNESPLGQALLSHKIDDEVTVEAPAGTLRFRIIGFK